MSQDKQQQIYTNKEEYDKKEKSTPKMQKEKNRNDEERSGVKYDNIL